MINESQNAVDDGPMVVAEAVSLTQADVICAVLRTNDIEPFILNENSSQTLPHMGVAINPRGIQVAVRKADQPAAKLLLDQHHISEDEKKASELNDADRFARSAGASFLLTLIVSLLIIPAIWYFFRAVKSRKKSAPTDKRRFRRNMMIAKLGLAAAIAEAIFFIILFFRVFQ